jgi:hypothetical protein
LHISNYRYQFFRIVSSVCINLCIHSSLDVEFHLFMHYSTCSVGSLSLVYFYRYFLPRCQTLLALVFYTVTSLPSLLYVQPTIWLESLLGPHLVLTNFFVRVPKNQIPLQTSLYQSIDHTWVDHLTLFQSNARIGLCVHIVSLILHASTAANVPYLPLNMMHMN